eukprot:1545515-Rhodomonas_salina.1
MPGADTATARYTASTMHMAPWPQGSAHVSVMGALPGDAPEVVAWHVDTGAPRAKPRFLDPKPRFLVPKPRLFSNSLLSHVCAFPPRGFSAGAALGLTQRRWLTRSRDRMRSRISTR